MPIIILHGVSVRGSGPEEFARQVGEGLKEAGVSLKQFGFFWGNSAASLRWGGSSIPGLKANAGETLRAAQHERIPLADLRAFLVADPLVELTAFHDPKADSDDNAQLRRMRILSKQSELTTHLHTALSSDVGWKDAQEKQFIADCVDSTLKIAIETTASVTADDLFEPMARALTAAFYSRIAPPTETAILGSPDVWSPLYEVVLASIKDTYGVSAGIFDGLKNAFLNYAMSFTPQIRNAIAPAVVAFAGDIVLYSGTRGAFLDALHEKVLDAKRNSPSNEPLWMVGHSFGGIMAFDYCVRYPLVTVNRLATVGSQVGLLAEGDMLYARNPGGNPSDSRPEAKLTSDGKKRIVPGNLKSWANIYDLRDALSFACSPIFDRVSEQATDNGVPFPESHGAYFARREVYDLIAHL